jgi:flagellar biosynthetic protein FlhB
MEIMQILAFTGEMSAKMLLGVLFVMFVIAGLDYFYQKFEYMRNMKMSLKDIKDEYKQQEGDPIIKQKLRAIRMERSRKRMMANVPDSDVVITNPTHVSVALKYDPLVMDAPEVVAMGKDKVALKIREIAKQHKITIVRNPPLARALFATAKVDEEIPVEHFRAVAQVIGYVYRLQGRTLESKAADRLKKK